MKKLCTLLVALLVLLLSCNKEGFDGNLNSNEYLIFGKFYSECVGNCVNLYKIEDQKLYRDDLNWGLPDEIPFQSKALDSAKFEIAKILIEAFPTALLKSNKRRYGCPDCADQGGFYIELKENGERNIWLIDVFDIEQNLTIINYKNKIDEVLRGL